MKKRLLIMAAALMAVVMPMRAQGNLVFTEDFETTAVGQMPEGWIVYGDGMANHSNYASFGDSWQVYDFEDLSKRALSISWKADAVASDRWMVTPAIALPAGGNPRLKFDTWGYDDSYPEQYKVMVSTTGTAKEDFVLLYDISAVAAGDATHMTSLAAYAGQTVYLAFVNYGDGYYGEIDNIQVGEFAGDGIELMHVLVPSHVPQGEEIAVQLRVRNTGAGMLNSFTYVVVAGSDTVQGVMTCMLSPYEEEYYIVYVPATALGTLNISATVLLPNGNADPDASDNAAVATTTVYDPAQTVERTALVELFNTALTPYGPTGDQLIAGAVAPYADNVVWITHHSGYNTDSMTSEISQSMVELFGSSSWAPALAIDRNEENVHSTNDDGVVGSYGNAETNIPAALQRPAFGSVSVSTFVYDTTTRVLMAAIDVELLSDINNPRINLYIVEDGIVGSQASTGGATISDYVHNNVVRGAITGTWGDELSVSNGHAAALYNYTLPAEWDASHCRLVAFVSEYGDGVRQRQVINATQTGYLCGDQGGSTPVETDTNINTITVVNDGGGFLIYSNDYESWYLMGGDTATFTGVPGQSLWIQTITASPVSSYYDTANYPGSRLNSILMDGEQVAIDGTDSRVTVGDLMGTTGYIYYEMAVSFDAPHTLVFSYGPYADASVCDVAQGLTTEVTGNTYATLRWIADPNGHDEFSVSISQDGVALSIEPQYSTSGNYHYCTFEGLTANSTYQVAVTNACGVASYEFTTYGDMHSVVFENQGGGFMQYRTDNGQFVTVTGLDTLNGYDGAMLLVRTMTDQGAGYAPEGAEVFQSLYVDGQEAEMDAYQQDGYIMYLYEMTFDANHTVTAIFAPAQTDTTVVPGGDTTVTAECVAPQNLIWGNTTDEGFATMWDMPEESGVTYYLYLYLGEQLVAHDSVTDGNYYEFHDLQPLTDYLLVVARLCPEGPQTTTENVRTLGEAHTITINNEGRGLVRNYSTNERYFDTTFTRYAGGWLNLVFYSFAPETGLEYGWENYQLQHFYVDGAEVTLADDSNSVYILRSYDYMAEDGYMVYLLSIRTDADHTLRFVYGTDSSYVPEQHTITVFNHGRGYMDDQTYQGYGYFTQNVNVLSGTASDYISLRIFSMPGAQAAAYGFGTDSTMLVGLAIDGETIAIDGSDSRLTVNHHEDGTIGYTYNYLYFDADHTVEAWFAPWELAPVDTNINVVTVVNDGGGFLIYSNDYESWYLMGGDTATFTGVPGQSLWIQTITASPVSSYYDTANYPGSRLNSILMDGEQVAIDGTDSRVTVGDLMGTTGYIYYEMAVSFDAPHTLVFSYGPYADASVCDVAQGLTTEVTGNTYATLRWIADPNGHDEFSVSISQDGVALSIEPQYSTSGNYHYCTFEGLTANSTYQVAVTNACGVASYEFTTYGDMHSVVFENQGGGFMQYRTDNGQFVTVTGLDTLNGYDGAMLLVRTMTDQGAGYAPEGAEVFQSLYVDGQEAEMDAYQQDGYIMYLYEMTFDANHTVTAIFAPAQTDTTVVPGGDTTVTAECVAPQNLIWGNTTDEGFATMWDMPEESGVTYYLYLYLGEQLVAHDSVTDGNYYEFHDLQPLTDYLLVVARLCPEGPQTTTENVRTLGEAHTITINNEGRGLVRNYSTNERYFDTTFTRYAGGWLNLVFYSFAPETGLEYGWENYQLQHFYVDGAEVTLADDSNSVYILRSYDYMAEDGYMVYLLSIRTDADHTLRFVYGTDSSYVPEQHTITVFNHGRGYMDDQTYQGYGYFTQNVNVLSGTASDYISLRIFSMPGAQAAAYGFGTDSTMLVGLAIDGETIAIDGSDSRLTVNHHEDGTIGYTYNYLYFDADHTVEAWFAPWEETPVVNHTLSLHNQGGGYMYNTISGTWFYGDTTMTVQEGYYTRYQIVSFDPDTAESFGIERDAAQVKHIYVNGVDVMARYTDTSHTHYWLGYGDRMADAGYEVFNLFLFFERDLNVVVEFGPAGEAPQPCTPDTVYVTETVHDTVYVPQTVYDTVYVPQTVYDTVRVVEYVYIHDTVYADTLRIYVHDTVVDTVYVGLDDVEDGLSAKLYSRDGQIVVEGAEGAMVVLYDAVGRQVALRRDDYDAVRFDVPVSGTYLVRIGNHAARRIVVVK